MNRALAIVTILSLFVAGVAIGALGMNLYSGGHIDRHDRPHGPGGESCLRRLHRHLDLTADQEQEIEAILKRNHAEAHELRSELQPRVRALMDRAHEEIEAILDPRQREEFQRLIARSRRHAEHFFLGPPGRHGRRPHGADRHSRRPWRDRHSRRPSPDRPDRDPGAPPPERFETEPGAPPPERFETEPGEPPREHQPGEPATERPEE